MELLIREISRHFRDRHHFSYKTLAAAFHQATSARDFVRVYETMVELLTWQVQNYPSSLHPKFSAVDSKYAPTVLARYMACNQIARVAGNAKTLDAQLLESNIPDFAQYRQAKQKQRDYFETLHRSGLQ